MEVLLLEKAIFLFVDFFYYLKVSILLNYFYLRYIFGIFAFIMTGQ